MKFKLNGVVVKVGDIVAFHENHPHVVLAIDPSGSPIVQEIANPDKVSRLTNEMWKIVPKKTKVYTYYDKCDCCFVSSTLLTTHPRFVLLGKMEIDPSVME